MAGLRTRFAVSLNKFRSDLLFRRFASILSIDILVKASALFLIPIYLRLMTQDEYGLYNYLLSIVSTFTVVLNFGLYVPQSKYYHDAAGADEKGSLIFTIATTLLTLLTVIIVPIYAFGLDNKIIGLLFKNSIAYPSYRIPLLLAILITIFSFMLTNFFYTSEKIFVVKRYNLSRIVGLNAISLSALFFLTGDNVETRLKYTYLAELLIFLVFSYYFFKEVKVKFIKKISLSALRMGLPIMLSAIFGIVINFSDKFFLEKYGSFTDLSNYYLAFSFASVIPLIFTSLQNIWVPLFMKEKNLSANLQKTKYLSTLLAAVFAVLAVGVWVAFKIMIETGIIPEKYNSVVTILPLLLLTQIFASLAPLYGNYLVYFEKTYLISITGFFICGLSLLLSLWLIPRWGVYGAAITTLVSNLCYLIVYFIYVRRIVNEKLAKQEVSDLV